jgi:hypothetical protein
VIGHKKFFSKCRATGRNIGLVNQQQVEESHKKHKEPVALKMIFIFSPILSTFEEKLPMFNRFVAPDFLRLLLIPPNTSSVEILLRVTCSYTDSPSPTGSQRVLICPLLI